MGRFAGLQNYGDQNYFCFDFRERAKHREHRRLVVEPRTVPQQREQILALGHRSQAYSRCADTAYACARKL